MSARDGRKAGEGAEDAELESLYGVHPVLEALERGHRSLERILVAKGRSGAKLGRLLRTARLAGVPVSYLPRQVLARKAGARAVHQGVVAVVSAIAYSDPARVCAGAARDPESVLVALDGVADPRNLGAIVRTAAAIGARGILLGGRGTVGLTPVVAKTAAGALESLPVARVHRLASVLKNIKNDGFRVVGLHPRGDRAWDEVDLTGRLVFVAGGEERGLRPGILDTCDHRLTIPVSGAVDSLNVSVAVGVVLFEAVRQRRLAGRTAAGEFGQALERAKERC